MSISKMATLAATILAILFAGWVVLKLIGFFWYALYIVGLLAIGAGIVIYFIRKLSNAP